MGCRSGHVAAAARNMLLVRRLVSYMVIVVPGTEEGQVLILRIVVNPLLWGMGIEL
ncbi:MAG: hypothetical protein JWN85_1459 [Gammaproteobacteria bacterium]|nr:hypothetical protein [Gammaproteobacteria bacterium]